ncbi:MAG: transglutaminase domain protein [Solirubrobacterales bacterium]|nr:transglutaminase domain protein [Solirubrobacterales bacterium]
MRRALALLSAAAALAAVAGVLPAPTLLVPAVGLAIVPVAGWASVAVAARRLRISRLVLTQEAVEDRPFDLRFEVGGLGRLPVGLEALLDGAWVPLAAGGGEVSLTIGRRGAYRLGPSLVRVRDALGIAERRLHVGRPEPLLVLPRPDAGAPAARPWASPADDVDLDGLVPYVPGTPIGRIHWPALARGAGLHARRITAAVGGLPLVVVDTGGNPGVSAVDWAARASAGQILALARRGGCRVLLPGDRAATTVTDTAGQWRTVHRRLALMQPSAHRAAPASLADVRANAVRIDATRAPAAASGRTPTLLPPEVEPG